MHKINYLKQISLILTVVLCFGCNLSPSLESAMPTFKNLECSYDGSWTSKTAFSIKIDQQGNAVLSKNRWDDRKYYSAKLGPKDLNILFSLVGKSEFVRLQPVYTDMSVDGHFYSIWITNTDSLVKKIRVYRETVPKTLDSLQKVICMIQDSITLRPINNQVHFRSRDDIYPNTPFPKVLR